MRLGQLARELKIKPSEIVKFLSDEHQVSLESGPNAKVEDEHIILVKDKFAPKKVEETVSQKLSEEETAPVPEKKTPKKKVAEPEDKVSEDNETFPDPKTIVVDPNAELIRARKSNFQGFKVVDKIDLPETNERTVIEVDGVMLSPEEVEQRKEKEKAEREAAIEAEKERKAILKAEKEKQRQEAEEKRLEKLAIDREKKRKREEEEAKRKKAAEEKKKKEEKTTFYREQMKAKAQKPVKKKKKKAVEVEEESRELSEEEKAPEEPKTGLAKLWQWFNT